MAGAITPTPLMRAVLERTETADGAPARLGVSHDATFYLACGYVPRHLMPENGVRLEALNAGGKVVWSYGASQ